MKEATASRLRASSPLLISSSRKPKPQLFKKAIPVGKLDPAGVVDVELGRAAFSAFPASDTQNATVRFFCDTRVPPVQTKSDPYRELFSPRRGHPTRSPWQRRGNAPISALSLPRAPPYDVPIATDRDHSGVPLQGVFFDVGVPTELPWAGLECPSTAPIRRASTFRLFEEKPEVHPCSAQWQ